MANEYFPKGMQVWLPKGMRHNDAYPQDALEDLLEAKLPRIILQADMVIDDGLQDGKDFPAITRNSLHVLVARTLYELHTEYYSEDGPLDETDRIVRGNLLDGMLTQTRRIMVNEVRPTDEQKFKNMLYTVSSLAWSVILPPLGIPFAVYFIGKGKNLRAQEWGADLLEGTAVGKYRRAYDTIEPLIHDAVLENTRPYREYFSRREAG
ncbi:hypothetical protein JXB02_05000 [Candidatus Woesearchaeota archaeon]|nr:hypothetical protein [Candidatus Woesearchaeota archaeon]